MRITKSAAMRLFTKREIPTALGLAVAPPAWGASPSAAAATDVVNVKDAMFGAVGDGAKDDTRAIQAAIDYCFGPQSEPHGQAAHKNKVLLFPPGQFNITTPLLLSRVHGGRVLGSGRFVTKITNAAGSSVFTTNGCQYSHFEGMELEGTGNATIFDLSWDGAVVALQSNTFQDILFLGGAIGMNIGQGGYMGSENLFLNCFWGANKTAGLVTSNFNALQNTIIGGNFQTCGVGVWVAKGSVPLIASVGFQQSANCDVLLENSADDTITLDSCRSESRHFFKVTHGDPHFNIRGCSQIDAGDRQGEFINVNGSTTGIVESCVSVTGQTIIQQNCRVRVANSSFGRTDWISIADGRPGLQIELDSIQFGGTTNRVGDGKPQRIAKQRITDAGTFNYVVQPSR
jgi:Pectate lyase superfamily protein